MIRKKIKKIWIYLKINEIIKDINKLNINLKFGKLLLIISLILLLIFCFLLFIRINYFSKKGKIFKYYTKKFRFRSSML